jgi:hypothetical protein
MPFFCTHSSCSGKICQLHPWSEIITSATFLNTQQQFNANSSRNVHGPPLSITAWHVVLSKSDLAMGLTLCVLGKSFSADAWANARLLKLYVRKPKLWQAGRSWQRHSPDKAGISPCCTGNPFNRYVCHMLHGGRTMQANIMSAARSKSSKYAMAQPDFDSILLLRWFLRARH